MDYVVVTGAKPYDGRYEFDIELAGLTTLEWGWIKRHAGYLPATILDGYRGSDPELFTVFAVIAMHRNGTIREQDVPDVYEKLARLPFDETVTIEPDTADQGDDADGPPPGSSSLNGTTSGPGSTTSSERSEPGLPATGAQSSDTSVSVPVTSPA